MEFNYADWAIFAVVVLSALISLIRGFAKEAMSLLIWIAAYIISATFAETLAAQMVSLDLMDTFKLILARVIIFVSVLIFGAIVNYFVGKFVETTGLNGTDMLMGVVFGTFRGVIIVLAVLLLIPEAIPVDKNELWQTSRLIPQFLQFEEWARQSWADLWTFFQQW